MMRTNRRSGRILFPLFSCVAMLCLCSDARSEPFRVYFSNGQGLWQAEWGTTKSFFYDSIPITALTLDVPAGRIYWAENGATPETRRIRRANLEDGSCVSDVVVTAPDAATSLAVDSQSGKLYWTAGYSVWRASLNGSNVEELISQPGGYVASISVDHNAGKVYWLWLVTSNDSRIRRANLEIPAGQSPADRTDVEDPIVSPFGIGEFVLDPDAGNVYWYEGGPGLQAPRRLKRATIDGQSTVQLQSDFGGSSIQIDPAGAIYYNSGCSQSGQNNRSLERYDLLAATTETLRCFSSSEPSPTLIALRLYPNKPCSGADMNGDGHVDGSDIEQFVAKLLCSP